MSTAEYQRQWRAKHGANTGKIGRPISAPCGTVSAYKRHTRNGQPPCQQCREAWAAYQRQRYHSRKADQ